ncbi:sugar ABC transporter permease [Streptomyces litchfieldiae]|uniref:Xylose transport system permease protein XylH n=1 Tax=Streptomyces litchfieldiae TaxID=3075543 RepID=A0ABU2MME2_9ACTN|nr:sugar ABC transporter permease [Streptomyces sp. DSM 44938]MDT0342771.1 sugar ABC transporter permease [Streptomyces sp. DSM 44938]
MTGTGSPGDTEPGRRRADPRLITPGKGVRGAWTEFRRKSRSGELGSLPVIGGLVAIWLVFQSLDNTFLSPRNLSNLSVDIVGMGLIAVGIVFVLLVGDIDLSIGSVSGLTAAAFAVLNVNHGVEEWLGVLIALLFGAAIGVVQGFFVARVGVPAFVVTLAGLLGWNGLMLYIMGTDGSFALDDEGLVATLTSHYFTGPGVAFGLAALSVAVCLATAVRERRRRVAAGLPARPPRAIGLVTAALAVVAFSAAFALTQFQGMPLALLIFLAVLVGLDFLLRRTTYGRKVFALGGGLEAARRTGINVVWVRISVFTVSGTMAAAGGLFLASRINSVGTTSGGGELMIDVIAAAVIGGTSLFGGRGTPWSALLGVLVIQSIASGMALLGVAVAIQSMITGGVLLAAVVIDSLSRRLQTAHGRA